MKAYSKRKIDPLKGCAMAGDTRFWTHYWTEATLISQRPKSGSKLEHTAGNQFLTCGCDGNGDPRGVKPGDFVYCVSSIGGEVILIARLLIDEIGQQEDANIRFGPDDIWQADCHLFTKEANGSKRDFERFVPPAILRRLEFITKKRKSRIKFQGISDRIDQQTLRRVRELTPGSAKILDEEVIKPTKRKR
jgi:hypothetical protein